MEGGGLQLIDLPPVEVRLLEQTNSFERPALTLIGKTAVKVMAGTGQARRRSCIPTSSST